MEHECETEVAGTQRLGHDVPRASDESDVTYAQLCLGSIGLVTEPAVTTFGRRNDSSLQQSRVLWGPHFIDDGIFSVFESSSILLRSQENRNNARQSVRGPEAAARGVRVLAAFADVYYPDHSIQSQRVNCESPFPWLRCKV